MLAPKLFTDYLFSDFFDDFDKVDKKLYGKHANREMLTDIKEHDNHYDLEVDLPGFKKDEISIELNNGYLSISATKGLDETDKDKEGKIIRREKYFGSMSRSFYIGEDIKTEDIKARYEDGILTLSVPKIEKTKEIENNNRILIE